jgi:exopolyphosphatase/guanosine-5'-triphosphate,3'-diphosphate pyrophosphatase
VLDLAERRKATGIGPKRAEIIVPGVSVLLRVLEDFRLPCLYYSAAGVRDGIIADLHARGVGRELAQLSRDQRKEVEQMSRRYGVALPHARKVAGLAHTLFTDLQPLHQLPPHFGKLLEAAAYLHDAGHFVSDSNHHKHSYYLVNNSDMPGFTNRERALIANLVPLSPQEHAHAGALQLAVVECRRQARGAAADSLAAAGRQPGCQPRGAH